MSCSMGLISAFLRKGIQCVVLVQMLQEVCSFTGDTLLVLQAGKIGSVIYDESSSWSWLQ